MRCEDRASRKWLTVSCDDVPCRGVERYRSQRNEEGRFGGVDEGTERHDCYVVVEDNRDRATTFMHGRKFYVRTLSPMCIRYVTTPSTKLVGIGLHKAA
jgi:hypothetical protein